MATGVVILVAAAADARRSRATPLLRDLVDTDDVVEDVSLLSDDGGGGALFRYRCK